jgi:hypothetical protein
MKLVARRARRELYARQVVTATALRDAPFVGSQFAYLLWNHSVERGVDTASALLSSLIDSGCRYIVCAGLDCEWWHDLAATSLPPQASSSGTLARAAPPRDAKLVAQ